MSLVSSSILLASASNAGLQDAPFGACTAQPGPEKEAAGTGRVGRPEGYRRQEGRASSSFLPVSSLFTGSVEWRYHDKSDHHTR